MNFDEKDNPLNGMEVAGQENGLPPEVADVKKIVDMYAHDYRDMAMGEDELAVMLYRFTNSVEAEQYRAGAVLADKFGWNK